MIPEVDRQRYEELWAQVIQVQAAIAPSSPQDPGPDIGIAIAELQRIFQVEILLDGDSLNSDDAGGMAQRLRSLNVEINKQLKLLAMDLLFLQAAQQVATVEQRRQQMGKRLEMLERYCAGAVEMGR